MYYWGREGTRVPTLIRQHLPKKSLGIGHAKGLFVHSATLRPINIYRWLGVGFAMALSVTFTPCNARQARSLPSDGYSSRVKNLASVRITRPEQKTPAALSPLRNSDQAFISRKQVPVPPRYFDGPKCFGYAVILPGHRLKPLCPAPNSAESTRGPPRGGPFIFC